MEDQLHVVVGTGALGLAVMRALHAQDRRIRVVNRSEPVDIPPGIEVRTGDITDPASAREVCADAGVVYHCAQAPYAEWPEKAPPIMRGMIEGASAAQAILIYGDNLYMYGQVAGPITEGLVDHPTGPNSRTRAQLAQLLLKAHLDGTVRATIGRASDFYGQYARNSKVGDLVFPAALSGGAARVLGNPDTPHTYTFIDDFARALVTLGERSKALGEVWHVPSAPTLTTRQFVEMVYRQAGTTPKLAVAPGVALALMALFNANIRASREVLHQSERPWVVDHNKFERHFGSHTTPHEIAIEQTLSWYRALRALST